MQRILLISGICLLVGAASFMATARLLDLAPRAPESLLASWQGPKLKLVQSPTTKIQKDVNGLRLVSTFSKLPTSGGKTGGAHIVLPPKLEAAFGGKRIRVVLKVSAPYLSQDPKPHWFSAAYSTAMLGNSRWRKFAVQQAGVQEVSFEYTVPRNEKSGKGRDFIGVLGDANGLGRPLLVHAVEVHDAIRAKR